jgi:hypothetical protein
VFITVVAIVTGKMGSLGLNEPTPMIAPILFWMEGNSSINFGLANHLQQFHFGWVLKKKSLFLNF